MSLRLYLLVDDERPGLLHRRRKRQREIYALVTRSILPNIKSTLADDYLPERYPWCFVISQKTPGEKYYAGALTIYRNQQGIRTVAIVYCESSYQWLQENLRTEFPVTFWLARILNNTQQDDFSEDKSRPLRQWLTALRRAYSPFRESFLLRPAYRFTRQSQTLLREGSQEDYCIRDSDGVEVMPWKTWPDCLQREAGIWLWRQSRQRHILDSQRIPLRRAEAEPPDASL